MTTGEIVHNSVLTPIEDDVKHFMGQSLINSLYYCGFNSIELRGLSGE
jgi:hypothetical protein